MLTRMRRACTSWSMVLPLLCALSIWSGCRWQPEGPPGSTVNNGTAVNAVLEPVVESGQESQPEEAVEPSRDPVADPIREDETPPAANQPEDSKPDPQAVWKQLIDQTGEYLRRDALDEARQNLDRLKNSDLELTAEQTRQLASAEAQLQRRLADRQLQASVRRLASPKREEVLSAQETLFERSSTALPLLREATRDDDPRLVRNTLEMLRVLRRPEDTLPIMVGVLQRPQQEPNWPDAVREIEATAAPGAGRALLELVLSSDLPRQRIAALDALARVVDPPRETVVALLPMILQDGALQGGAELAAALTAANHALAVNGQHGLLSGRGLDVQLSAEQIERLGALPARLSQIAAADPPDGPSGEAAVAAKMLGIATRQIPAEPLLAIRVLAFSDEMIGSRAAAVLDGQWNTVEQKAMWRHSTKRPATIVLDLGAERTVSGVRIWNLNESGGSLRGWKDVAVCVGSAAASLSEPTAQGIVPQAPGKADGTDYSTLIPVDFVRGRYVRLRAESVWKKESHAGLTEVQVLGF